MNSEDRFKRSLEDLINSKEFPFDETNWEKASEMIAASKETRKRFVPLILTGLLLLISGLGGLYLLNNSGSPAPGQLAVKPAGEPKEVLKRPSTGNFAESLPKSHFKEHGINPRPSVKRPGAPKTPVNPDEKEITALPLKNTSSGNTNPPLTTTTRSETEPVKNGTSTDVPQISSAIPALNVPVKENGSSPETKINTPDNTAVAAHIASETITTGEELKTRAEEKTSTGAETNVPANIPPGEYLSSDQAIAGTETEKSDKPVNSGSNEALPVAIPDPASLATNTVMTEKEAEKALPLAGSTPSTGTILTNEETETPPAIDLGEIGKPKELPTLLSVEAGASYLYGWQNPTGRDAHGFNLVLGMNYFNHVTSKIAFSYGIQYTSTGNLGFSSHTTKVTRLNLGEESKVTVFTPVKVHYLLAPLRFNYAINPQNAIGIGCNAAYLLTVESEVESYDQKLNVRGESVITKETGYTEGFSQFDIQASAFYRRRLYPNLSVNMEIFYGLSDVKDNTFFKLDAFERNTGIKLTLVYNILKK